MLVKLLKGTIYEEGLAEFATILEDRQREIAHVLSLHATGSPVPISSDSAYATALLLEQFRLLETPCEKQLKKYVDENGGSKTFVLNHGTFDEIMKIRFEWDLSVGILGKGLAGGFWYSPYSNIAYFSHPSMQSGGRGTLASEQIQTLYDARMMQQEGLDPENRSIWNNLVYDLRPWPPIILPLERIHGRVYPAAQYGGHPVAHRIIQAILKIMGDDPVDTVAKNAIPFQRKFALQKKHLTDDVVTAEAGTSSAGAREELVSSSPLRWCKSTNYDPGYGFALGKKGI